ncbi:MAG: SDR family NAD(P)-dependent oxidoreductase [Ktedonobacterales bacterium]
MKIDLVGRTALVTGGSIGIGEAIAVALAEAGADVVVTYKAHAPERVLASIGRAGRKAVAFPMDATDSESVNETVAQAAEAMGGHLDILINNAGGLVGRVPLAEMPNSHWHAVLDLNLSSAFYCSRGLALHECGLGAHRACVIGGRSYGWRPGRGGICCGKGGYAGADGRYGKGVCGAGITVNAVAPGFIGGTPFHDTFTSAEGQQSSIAGTLVKRAGTPEDVAGLVLYLASDLASFVTGEVAEINGGAWFA